MRSVFTAIAKTPQGHCTAQTAHSAVVHLGYLKTILLHPTRHQTFAGKLHLVLCNILDLVLAKRKVSKILRNDFTVGEFVN